MGVKNMEGNFMIGIPIELEREYDEYFTACERANKIPLSFEKWIEAGKPEH